MGTKVHCESYFPGYYSMRDPNEGSSSSNWPLLYGDKSLGNGLYRDSYLARNFPNAYPGGEKDVLRKKMLEHEAEFKHQVFELHRLYKTQRDMMDDIKRKELNKRRLPMETSSSSSPLASQMHLEDAWKMRKPNSRYLNSVSGVEINCSPWSCTGDGNMSQPDRSLSQNGFNAKDCEIVECRPSKVRKKLFDLQLPPDEYMDTEEEEQAHNKISEISGFEPPSRSMGIRLQVESNGNHSMAPSSCLNNPIAIADLNEPVQVEEATNNPISVSLSNSKFLLGLQKEVLTDPRHWSGINGIPNGVHAENKGCGRERLSKMYEKGHSRYKDLNFNPHCHQRVKSLLMSPKPRDGTHNKVDRPLTVLQSDHVRGNLWREKHPEKSRDLSGSYHVEPLSNFTHKLTSTQSPASLNPFGASNMSSRSPSQSHETFMNKWQFCGSYCGPSSENMQPPPRFPSTNSEVLKCDKYAKVVSERSTNCSSPSFFKESDLGKDVNLNIPPNLRSSCIETVDLEKKCEDPMKGLPWLKTETEKITEKKIFGVPIFEKSCCTPKDESSSLVSTSASLKSKNRAMDINVACEMECGTEIAEEVILIEKRTIEKKADFRTLIDLNSCISEEDEITLAPSVASTSANGKIVIDLEVPALPESDEDILPVEQHCDEAVVIAAETMITISSFDLLKSVEGTTSHPLEDTSSDPLFWFVEVVSTLLGNIEKSGIESRGEESGIEGTLPNVVDDFEALTLNLKEMTEEEYIPEPLAPEICETDENWNTESGKATVRSRPRKCQLRRGRHRRDFQRDILPGLASLSRHEVTEDIQAFGGIMRATGHVWSSGLTRRKGARNRGGRGRRRVAMDPPILEEEPTATCPSPTQGLNSIGVSLEDRSLTIWGKTPRRPRRRRGSPGHPPLVPLA